MRPLRIKPEGMDCWYHCCNRIAGRPGDRPLGRADKEAFLRILQRLSLLYTTRVCAFMVMDNHIHLLIKVPKEMPSIEEVLKRYSDYHSGRRTLEPDSPAVTQWQERLRDISSFMGQLERLFTIWYNQQHGRRGCLWSGRFRSSLLEEGAALWRCWKYIEFNPVRAGKTTRVAEYRFGSYGTWSLRGTHMFREEFTRELFPAMQNFLGTRTESELMQLMTDALLEAGDQSVPIVERSGYVRRLRYWTDGLVIGSELYIRRIMADPRSSPYPRLQDAAGEGLYYWRSLRPQTVGL